VLAAGRGGTGASVPSQAASSRAAAFFPEATASTTVVGPWARSPATTIPSPSGICHAGRAPMARTTTRNSGRTWRVPGTPSQRRGWNGTPGGRETFSVTRPWTVPSRVRRMRTTRVRPVTRMPRSTSTCRSFRVRGISERVSRAKTSTSEAPRCRATSAQSTATAPPPITATARSRTSPGGSPSSQVRQSIAARSPGIPSLRGTSSPVATTTPSKRDRSLAGSRTLRPRCSRMTPWRSSHAMSV
jgi:hypothetical protein